MLPDDRVKRCADYWAARNAERAEDVRWMAATGEHAMGAAQRLGLTYAAFEQWARRNTPDEWAALIARNPRDLHCRSRGQNQWTTGMAS